MGTQGSNFLSKQLLFQIKIMKIFGWILIVLGVPLCLLIVGFPMVIGGIAVLWGASYMKKKATPENISEQLANLGAVMGEIQKGAKE